MKEPERAALLMGKRRARTVHVPETAARTTGPRTRSLQPRRFKAAGSRSETTCLRGVVCHGLDSNVTLGTLRAPGIDRRTERACFALGLQGPPVLLLPSHFLALTVLFFLILKSYVQTASVIACESRETGQCVQPFSPCVPVKRTQKLKNE